MAARVICIDQRGASVRLRIDPNGAALTVRAHVRASLRERLLADGRERVVVGDAVLVEVVAEQDVVIVDVEARRSELKRRTSGGAGRQLAIANADTIAVVVSARQPTWRPGFTDRVLCEAERAGVIPLIVVNKMDLVKPKKRAACEANFDVYRAMGVEVLFTSATESQGVDAVAKRLAGNATVLYGQSGVGKSTLINELVATSDQRVGVVSGQTGKGKHTTSASLLMPLPAGGYVIDVAGVRSFGLVGIDREEVRYLFRDLRPFTYWDEVRCEDQPTCAYQSCLHVNEKGCQVKHAVEAGFVSCARYDSYLRILESLDEYEAEDPCR